MNDMLAEQVSSAGRGAAAERRQWLSGLVDQYQQAGDEAALGTLCGELYGEAYGLLMHYTGGNPDTAADLTQDVMEKVIRHLPDFRNDNIGGWVATVCHNTFITHCRRGKRQAYLPLDENAELREETASLIRYGRFDSTATEAVERIYTDTHLTDLLDRLSPEFRETVRLVIVEGLSYEQVAELTATKRATVATRLWRGKRQLRAYLEQEVPLSLAS